MDESGIGYTLYYARTEFMAAGWLGLGLSIVFNM